MSPCSTPGCPHKASWVVSMSRPTDAPWRRFRGRLCASCLQQREEVWELHHKLPARPTRLEDLWLLRMLNLAQQQARAGRREPQRVIARRYSSSVDTVRYWKRWMELHGLLLRGAPGLVLSPRGRRELGRVQQEREAA